MGSLSVLTTHYMDEAEQLCDRLVVMDGGRIVAEGSPRSLIDRYSTREVVELRFGGTDVDDVAGKLSDELFQFLRCRCANFDAQLSPLQTERHRHADRRRQLQFLSPRPNRVLDSTEPREAETPNLFLNPFELIRAAQARIGADVSYFLLHQNLVNAASITKRDLLQPVH